MSNYEPAFPSHGSMGEVTHCGMTLRDYFAAKAMEAAIAHHGIYDEEQPHAAVTSATSQGYDAGAVASIAYTYADEMLAARERA